MLYAKYRHKDTHEDSKTSSVFENLMLLPDDVLCSVLQGACYDKEDQLPDLGELIDYQFWPEWRMVDAAGARHRVEPDLFLRFQNMDIIVESKLYEHVGQRGDQWAREIAAYRQTVKGVKELALLAIGGNVGFKNQTVGDVRVYVCGWHSLRESFRRVVKSSTVTRRAEQQRLIRQINLAFDCHQIMDVRWMADLPKTQWICSNAQSKFVNSEMIKWSWKKK